MLGIYKSLIAILFLFTKVFDVQSILLSDVNKNMDILCKSNIEFFFTEKLKDNKTSSWIATDYIEFVKAML